LDQVYLVGAVGQSAIGQGVEVSAEKCGGHRAARAVGKLACGRQKLMGYGLDFSVRYLTDYEDPCHCLSVWEWLNKLELVETSGQLAAGVLFVITADDLHLLVADGLVQVIEPDPRSQIVG